VNISGVNMEAENDNTGLPETCSACGKLFEDGGAGSGGLIGSAAWIATRGETAQAALKARNPP
jgi:hypothetical protein